MMIYWIDLRSEMSHKVKSVATMLGYNHQMVDMEAVMGIVWPKKRDSHHGNNPAPIHSEIEEVFAFDIDKEDTKLGWNEI